jgi:hypothetical protein
VEALIATGKLDEATLFLRDQVKQYKTEPELWDLMAKAYDKQGKQALQHIALAESYVLQGGVLSALDQLGIARKAPDASFYDQAVIDARERELQARRREEMGDKGKKDLQSAPAFQIQMSSGTRDQTPLAPHNSLGTMSGFDDTLHVQGKPPFSSGAQSSDPDASNFK